MEQAKEDKKRYEKESAEFDGAKAGLAAAAAAAAGEKRPAGKGATDANKKAKKDT